MIHDRIVYHIKFTLNGIEHRIEDYIDNFEWRQELSSAYFGLGNEAIYKALVKRFSEALAKEFMKNTRDIQKALISVS